MPRTEARPEIPVIPPPPLPERPRGLRIWHFSLISLYTAVAVVNIQDQRVKDPVLVGLAASGFVLYGAIAWLGWRYSRRFWKRHAPVLVVVAYLAAMAALFYAATSIYVALEPVVLARPQLRLVPAVNKAPTTP